MKRVEVWKSEDGQLHESAVRCAAANLHARLPQGVNPNSKVLSFSDCLTVMENHCMIERVFAELYTARTEGAEFLE